MKTEFFFCYLVAIFILSSCESPGPKSVVQITKNGLEYDMNNVIRGDKNSIVPIVMEKNQIEGQDSIIVGVIDKFLEFYPNAIPWMKENKVEGDSKYVYRIYFQHNTGSNHSSLESIDTLHIYGIFTKRHGSFIDERPDVGVPIGSP